MFPLHSSADHAFIINRMQHRKGSHQMPLPFTFSGADQSVSWDSVKIVKYLGVDVQTCPICLDTQVCPRITKCGHSFCLICLIRHVHSIGAFNGSTAVKCPCCGDDTLRLVDSKPVQFFNVTPPRAPLINNSNQGSTKKKQNINSQGTSMKFVKLHRDKISASPFLPNPNEPRRSVPHALPGQTDKDAMFCRFNYVEPHVLESILISDISELQSMPREDATFDICKSMAVEFVQTELKLALEEAPQEIECLQRFQESSSGVYQRHNPYLVAEVQSEPGRPSHNPKKGANGEAPQCQYSEQEASLSSETISRNRSASLESDVSYESSISAHELEGQSNKKDIDQKGHHHRRKGNKAFSPGSMYLGSDESLFYQADDGQLCFLCGFNVQCLRAEFSASPQNNSHANSTPKSRRIEPLPDVIQGRVVESERMVLTKQLRERMRFLSHLPIGSTVTMVEVGLGGILSNATKRQFAKDFQKRKATRDRKSKAEKRADDRAQRREEQRIEHIRAQVPLVNRVFRQEAIDVTSDAFGPSLCSSPLRETAEATTLATGNLSNQQQQSQGSLSFSSIARKANHKNKLQGFAQDDFPVLGGDSAFPALGSSPASPPSKHTATKWKGGNGKTSKKPIPLTTLTPLGRR